MNGPSSGDLAAGGAESRAPRARASAWSTLLALAGLLLALGAPLFWLKAFDSPHWRASSGALAGLALAGGLVLGAAAAFTDRRRWVRLALAADVFLLVVLAGLYFGFARLPGARAARGLERAPDFALSDHEFRRVVLSEELAKGPVLLVFYRGHW